MDFRNRLYRHVLQQSVGFLQDEVHRHVDEPHHDRCGENSASRIRGVGDLLMQTFALLGYAALVFYFDWRLAIFCLVSAPSGGLSAGDAGAKAQKNQRYGTSPMEGHQQPPSGDHLGNSDRQSLPDGAFRG